jgi:hypothetical protein
MGGWRKVSAALAHNNTEKDKHTMTIQTYKTDPKTETQNLVETIQVDPASARTLKNCAFEEAAYFWRLKDEINDSLLTNAVDEVRLVDDDGETLHAYVRVGKKLAGRAA